jgi:NitT/TauT family transport system substrate-binding protein
MLHRLGSPIRASLLALVAVVAATQTGTAQTVVRFGSVGGLTDAGLYIAEEMGFFKEAGLTVQMKRMANAPTLVTALATDQLDVAGIAITPGLFTSIQQGMGLRIVGDKQSFRPGFAATRLVVPPEAVKGSKEDAIKALKGKTVAITARASSTFANLESMLRDNGMSVADVKITQLAYPSMIAALSSGAVDAAYLIEPFLSDAIRRKVAVDVSNVGHRGSPGANRLSVPIVYSEKFAQNRAAGEAFMLAYVKGVRVYNDAFAKDKDKDKVIDIMARHSGVAVDVVRNSYPGGLDPDQIVHPASMEEMQKFFVEQKLMTTPVDISKLVDTSFAEAAVKKLGKYQ